MTEVDKLKEECGVFGIYKSDGKTKDIALSTYMGLCSLQHRGEESCGIAYFDKSQIKLYKDLGKVNEVFNEKILNNINGRVTIGHVRYSTCGKAEVSSAQPFLEKYYNKELAVVHNGNITNATNIKGILKNCIFKSNSDSEVIGKLIMNYIYFGIEQAVIKAVQQLQGAYSIIILFKDTLIAIRDPNGIRPLCLGCKDGSYIVSSESCALNAIGAEYIKDVTPGEMVMINSRGIESKKIFKNSKLCTCAFEYVYFSREDSLIDNIQVSSFRESVGRCLYKDYPTKGDMVVGIPDSGITYALGYAKEACIPYEKVFIRNKYVGRTFIVENREKLLKLKFSVLKEKVFDKKIIVVDDSLVRGNTIKIIIKALRKACAKEVHIRIASPKIKYKCPFGINIKTSKELIENNFSHEEMKRYIDADSLEYLSFETFKGQLKHKGGFCTGCFNGKYPEI